MWDLFFWPCNRPAFASNALMQIVRHHEAELCNNWKTHQNDVHPTDPSTTSVFRVGWLVSSQEVSMGLYEGSLIRCHVQVGLCSTKPWIDSTITREDFTPSLPWKPSPFLRMVKTIYFYGPSIPWRTVTVITRGSINPQFLLMKSTKNYCD